MRRRASLSTSPRSGGVSDAAVRAYRLLLRAYPAAFRAAYGGEMLQLFRDQMRDHRGAAEAGGARSGLGFWAAVLWDVLRSAPALRLDAARARWRARRDGRGAGPWYGADTQPMEGTMRTRTMAVLAVLGGLFQVVNTGAEVWAGYGGPYWGRPLGGWPLAMVLATLMGALLLAAGVLLLRRGPDATRRARAAALACLVLVVGLQFTFPFMSIFLRLLGVGIPVALLLATRPRGASGGDRSVPAAA